MSDDERSHEDVSVSDKEEETVADVAEEHTPAAPKSEPKKFASSTTPTGKSSLVDMSIVEELKRYAKHGQDQANVALKVAKDPQLLKQKLQSALPDRTFFIFFMIWLPFIAIAGGSLFGFILRLFTKNLHFVLALAAGAYVYKFVHSDRPHADRVKLAMLVSSLFPFIMIDETNFLVQLVWLVAFCGTPYLLTTYFPAKEKTDEEDVGSKESQNVLLMYAIAPAVIFAISAGGCSYVNAFVLILCFVAALFATQAVLPIVSANPAVPPVIKHNPELVFVAAEVLIAHLVLWILQAFILPESIAAEQNPIWASLIYIILGVGIVAGGMILQGRVPQVKIDDKVRENAVKGFTYAVLGSYGLLLLAYVGKHSIMAYLGYVPA